MHARPSANVAGGTSVVLGVPAEGEVAEDAGLHDRRPELDVGEGVARVVAGGDIHGQRRPDPLELFAARRVGQGDRVVMEGQRAERARHPHDLYAVAPDPRALLEDALAAGSETEPGRGGVLGVGGGVAVGHHR